MLPPVGKMILSRSPKPTEALLFGSAASYWKAPVSVIGKDHALQHVEAAQQCYLAGTEQIGD